MKKLLIIFCLFSVSAHAEWKVYSCIRGVGSNWNIFLSFDESRRVVQIGNGAIIKVSIDSSEIRFKINNVNHHIDRKHGIWRSDEPDFQLYCSRSDRNVF
jgi:hypothetical protein